MRVIANPKKNVVVFLSALVFIFKIAGLNAQIWNSPAQLGNSNSLNWQVRQIEFADVNLGWAVGEGGIIKTTNGGASWTAKSTGSNLSLSSLDFIDSSTGWVVGSFGTILKTVDGGDSWTDQTYNTEEHLSKVTFIDENIGWAISGSGTILKTLNGGATWQS